MAESPIPLQSDTLNTLPGGGVRTITTQVLINGVPTVCQMQVVVLADKDGAIQGDLATDDSLSAILTELQAIKGLLGILAGVPVFDTGPLSPQ